jgi:hypothetical protein
MQLPADLFFNQNNQLFKYLILKGVCGDRCVIKNTDEISRRREIHENSKLYWFGL